MEVLCGDDPVAGTRRTNHHRSLVHVSLLAGGVALGHLIIHPGYSVAPEVFVPTRPPGAGIRSHAEWTRHHADLLEVVDELGSQLVISGVHLLVNVGHVLFLLVRIDKDAPGGQAAADHCLGHVVSDPMRGGSGLEVDPGRFHRVVARHLGDLLVRALSVPELDQEVDHVLVLEVEE